MLIRIQYWNIDPRRNVVSEIRKKLTFLFSLIARCFASVCQIAMKNYVYIVAHFSASFQFSLTVKLITSKERKRFIYDFPCENWLTFNWFLKKLFNASKQLLYSLDPSLDDKRIVDFNVLAFRVFICFFPLLFLYGVFPFFFLFAFSSLSLFFRHSYLTFKSFFFLSLLSFYRHFIIFFPISFFISYSFLSFLPSSSLIHFCHFNFYRIFFSVFFLFFNFHSLFFFFFFVQ